MALAGVSAEPLDEHERGVTRTAGADPAATRARRPRGNTCGCLGQRKEETGRPWTDKHNPDPAQRGRPLVGVPVLYGLVPEGPGRWSGRLYNVDNGNSYAGRLLELGPSTIRVEGCAIGICGGQNMSRIK